MLIRLIVVFGSCGCFAASLFADRPLPGTEPLTETRPLDEVMVAGIDRFALAELQRAGQSRPRPTAQSRDRLAKIIGAVDQRIENRTIELIATAARPSRIAENDSFTIDAVRWPVLDGVSAEGLWLRPKRDPVARVVAIPDADWTPEMISGLQPSPTAYAADLATYGCEVLVPTLISRDHKFSGNPTIGKSTNLSHREFIYRQAFEVGRHVIGYEVQKVLAAVDQFGLRNSSEKKLPIAVVGAGEGGLLAQYSAAIDTRIDATVVSGYFDRREEVWQEPIYRNVWGLLTEFGDAELANMIAPRSLFVEPSPKLPEVTLPEKVNRVIAAPGSIRNKDSTTVVREFVRAADMWEENHPGESAGWINVVMTQIGRPPLETSTIRGLVSQIAGVTRGATQTAAIDTNRSDPEVQDDRQRRQVAELIGFTQRLLRRSHREREQRFGGIKPNTIEQIRADVYKTLIGKLPDPTIDANPRTRQIIDQPEYKAYEVVLDVYADVIASGVLLLPKDLKEGEKRPVVVCQHGLEGTPMSTIGGPDSKDYHYYKAMSVELVKRGFIVYAPQNPYRGQDKFRTLQRKSNPLGRSLFSYIIPQHLVTLRWLSSLPNVDRDRIGFYGLSYGGKTAMRVPPFLVPSETEPGYCLSICSADFNEWVSKNASVDAPFSYLWTGEYEIFEWNMAHVANYAELAMLISPRPFMVERGHDDGVGIDEWVAWEYAKVRRHYNKLGIGERTEIEFFDGPHTINGQGTYRFLHRHLRWSPAFRLPKTRESVDSNLR
jgi:dienelactone hydrolase